jgi:hypothetical protein
VGEWGERLGSGARLTVIELPHFADVSPFGEVVWVCRSGKHGTAMHHGYLGEGGRGGKGAG